MYLATIVHNAGDKVRNHQPSAITDAACSTIYSNVVLPAKQLQVNPYFAIRLLRLYYNHKGIDYHLAGHYVRKCCLGWWIVQSDKERALRLATDSLLVQLIAPNEQTRLLLGLAVERFAVKYCVGRTDLEKKGRLYVKQSDGHWSGSSKTGWPRVDKMLTNV